MAIRDLIENSITLQLLGEDRIIEVANRLGVSPEQAASDPGKALETYDEIILERDGPLDPEIEAEIMGRYMAESGSEEYLAAAIAEDEEEYQRGIAPA